MTSDVIDRTAGPVQPSTGAPPTGRPATARPGKRPRPGAPVQVPKSPVRPTSPVRSPGPGWPGRPVRAAARGAADVQQPGQIRRTSFVLLLLGLLGGGLVCLLVVNTTLAAGSIEISKLQQQNAAITSRVQELQQQIAVERSAAQIEKEAKRLGMRPDSALVFVNLRTKSIQQPSGAALQADQAAARSAAARVAARNRARTRQGADYHPSHGSGTGQ